MAERGRPSSYSETMGREIISLMAADVPMALNNKWRGVSETKWCAFAMERSAEWLPVIGKTAFDRYDLEYQVTFGRSASRKSGLSRFDAVGWRGGRATIIETKVKVTPSNLMAGVGQILYYRQVAERLCGWDVEELILLSPSWPPLFIESVEANALPVTLVMATPEMFYCRRTLGVQ